MSFTQRPIWLISLSASIWSVLDRLHLDSPQEKTEDDEQTQLLQSKGFVHEKKFADLLKSRHASFVDIVAQAGLDNDQRRQATAKALKEGIEVYLKLDLNQKGLRLTFGPRQQNLWVILDSGNSPSTW